MQQDEVGSFLAAAANPNSPGGHVWLSCFAITCDACWAVIRCLMLICKVSFEHCMCEAQQQFEKTTWVAVRTGCMGTASQCHLRAIESRRQEAGLMMAGCVIFWLSRGPLGTGSSREMACLSCCRKESCEHRFLTTCTSPL